MSSQLSVRLFLNNTANQQCAALGQQGCVIHLTLKMKPHFPWLNTTKPCPQTQQTVHFRTRQDTQPLQTHARSDTGQSHPARKTPSPGRLANTHSHSDTDTAMHAQPWVTQRPQSMLYGPATHEQLKLSANPERSEVTDGWCPPHPDPASPYLVPPAHQPGLGAGLAEEVNQRHDEA